MWAQEYTRDSALNFGLSLQAIGVDLDLSDKGLGIRSRRYAMLVDDGVVRPSSLASSLPTLVEICIWHTLSFSFYHESSDPMLVEVCPGCLATLVPPTQ